MTIKDSLAAAGIRFTAGAWMHRERIAESDAEAARCLKAAGAIILGKTNCPDLSSAVETDNPIFGLTHNPWDLNRSAGGSSGGEAALIAAGGSPLGLGADAAGSIRLPAALCSTCILKPTAGRIPTSRHDPVPPPAIAHWNTVGPLARRVEDLALALAVLSRTLVRDYQQIDLKGRRLIIPRLIPGTLVKKDIITALRISLEAFQNAGMSVDEGARLPTFKLAFEIMAVVHRKLFPVLLHELGGGQPIHLLPELAANWQREGRVSPAVLAILSAFSIFGPPGGLRAPGAHRRAAKPGARPHG